MYDYSLFRHTPTFSWVIRHTVHTHTSSGMHLYCVYMDVFVRKFHPLVTSSNQKTSAELQQRKQHETSNNCNKQYQVRRAPIKWTVNKEIMGLCVLKISRFFTQKDEKAQLLAMYTLHILAFPDQIPLLSGWKGRYLFCLRATFVFYFLANLVHSSLTHSLHHTTLLTNNVRES